MEILSVAALNQMVADTAMQSLGIEFVGMGDDWISAKMPVDKRTKQTHNVLHGGASVVLIESLGSIGAQLSTDRSRQRIFGIEVNANHVRAAHQGYVFGRAVPLHLGRSTQVWEVRISDEESRLISVGRLTVAVVDKERVELATEKEFARQRNLAKV